MQQTSRLIDTLKQALRQRGITYAQVANHLALSEASVKRLFSEKKLTLERLEHICQLAELDLIDLMDLYRQQQAEIKQLSWQQEAEIAADMVLVLVAISVINGVTAAQLVQQYRLSKHQIQQKLAQLDRLKIIDLQPGQSRPIAGFSQF